MKVTIREMASEIDPLAGRLVDLQGDIAVHLANALSAKGISQRQLADLTGMTESRISKVLSGDENLTLRTIVRIELALGEPLIESPMFRSYAPMVVGQSAGLPLLSHAAAALYPAAHERQQSERTAMLMLGAVACYARSTTRKQPRM